MTTKEIVGSDKAKLDLINKDVTNKQDLLNKTEQKESRKIGKTF